MKQTMLQLPEDMVRALDLRAAGRGMSRSALVREIVEESLGNDQQAIIGRQIADGYRRIPAATPDEWGDLAALRDANTRDLLHRLDSEERQQGRQAW